MLKKLLWKDKNNWQLAGATLGAFIGLFLLLLSQQFYFDFKYLLHGNEQNTSKFLTLNKTVIAYQSHFSEEELTALQDRKDIQQLATFYTSGYRVSASSPTFGFFTDLFFEAIDTAFIDVKKNLDQFSWKEGQREIPIIVSRDYIALYNFGFAPSQGLPQLNPDFLENFTLDLTLSGNGLKRKYKGRIVDYSDRIHSILVPIPFMEWANTTFSEQVRPGPSRLMLATDIDQVSALRQWIKEKGYEVSSGHLVGERIRSLLRAAIALIAFIGLVIVILSVLVFVINFQLLVARAKDRIGLLLELGYRPHAISQVLFRYLLKIFAVVLVLTLCALFAFRWGFQFWYNKHGLELGIQLHWSVYLTAIIFSMIVIGFNYRMIRRMVGR